MFHFNSPAAALWKQWENFAYALRKVSEYRRLCIEGQTKEDADFHECTEAHLLLPGITEYALGLCKRIVSSTIEALLFRGAIKHSGSISNNTKKFLAQIESVDLNMGDTKQFVAAWISINDWYWEIADTGSVQKDTEKGIRDLLEHRNVIMQVNLGAMGNYHVQFLGGNRAVMPVTYPVRNIKNMILLSKNWRR